MKALKEFIEQEIGIPISLLVKGEKLVPLYGTEADSYLFGSEIAKRAGAFLSQGDIKRFIAECPEGYVLIGHWGHGVNSYALYYQRVDEWSRIFFRLPFGGLYMDNDREARQIREFLINYFDFEKEIRNKVKSLTAVEAMYEGYYLIIPLIGQPIELHDCLYRNPDFKEEFSALFEGDKDEKE